MTSLYEIATAFKQDAEKLADLDLDAQTIADTLDGLSGDLETKAQGVAYFLKNLEATAASIKQAETDMAARRKALENRAERLRQYVFDSMQVAGIEKISCPHFVIAIKKNPAAVDLFEPGLLPAEFMTKPIPAEPMPDKKLIAAALKAGTDVPGARLQSGLRLDIR